MNNHNMKQVSNIVFKNYVHVHVHVCTLITGVI